MHHLSVYQVGLAPFDPITTFSDNQCLFERVNLGTNWMPQIIFHKDFASPAMLALQTIAPANANYTEADVDPNLVWPFLVSDNGRAIFGSAFLFLSPNVRYMDAHTLQHFRTIPLSFYDHRISLFSGVDI
jgi:hypothetical protein